MATRHLPSWASRIFCCAVVDHGGELTLVRSRSSLAARVQDFSKKGAASAAPASAPAMPPAVPGADGQRAGHLHPPANLASLSTELGIDCEMVGVGEGGVQSVLARVAIVDYDGRAVLDLYCKPTEKVTNYRSHITGITARDLAGADGAFDELFPPPLAV